MIRATTSRRIIGAAIAQRAGAALGVQKTSSLCGAGSNSRNVSSGAQPALSRGERHAVPGADIDGVSRSKGPTAKFNLLLQCAKAVFLSTTRVFPGLHGLLSLLWRRLNLCSACSTYLLLTPTRVCSASLAPEVVLSGVNERSPARASVALNIFEFCHPNAIERSGCLLLFPVPGTRYPRRKTRRNKGYRAARPLVFPLHYIIRMMLYGGSAWFRCTCCVLLFCAGSAIGRVCV